MEMLWSQICFSPPCGFSGERSFKVTLAFWIKHKKKKEKEKKEEERKKEKEMRRSGRKGKKKKSFPNSFGCILRDGGRGYLPSMKKIPVLLRAIPGRRSVGWAVLVWLGNSSCFAWYRTQMSASPALLARLCSPWLPDLVHHFPLGCNIEIKPFSQGIK